MPVSYLTREIEVYAARLQASHPLIVQARSGTLAPSALAAHLNNIRFSIQCGYRHMRRARRRALELGLEEVASFLDHKFNEEYGHDRWARDDIERLRVDYAATAVEPSQGTVELMQYLDEVIEADPRVYLAYIFFVEYLTVLAGPALVHALSDGCGIASDYVSVVARHVELDQAHVAEALNELDLLCRGVDRALWNQMLARAMDCFERSCTEAARLAA